MALAVLAERYVNWLGACFFSLLTRSAMRGSAGGVIPGQSCMEQGRLVRLRRFFSWKWSGGSAPKETLSYASSPSLSLFFLLQSLINLLLSFFPVNLGVSSLFIHVAYLALSDKAIKYTC